jgi:hypothetical protein
MAGVDAALLDAEGVNRLTVELSNVRDAAARWCATVLLRGLGGPMPDSVRAAIGQAAKSEPCQENLRAYAMALADINP